MGYLEELGQKAVDAKYDLQQLSTAKKNECLLKCADKLLEYTDKIIAANEMDMKKGRENHMPEGLLDRLLLNPSRIEAMAEGLKQIATLPDPVNELLESFDRPNGLHIEKRRVPLGVIGIIYEARPNVTADAFALCFKAGNAVILKGGSDAICSNLAVADALRAGLRECGINENAVSVIEKTDREITVAFMKLKDYINVLIPRGGAGLIRKVVEEASIPVIETGTGNCHIYIDEFADLEKAVPIVFNAKTQRIGVCNACESLLVHEKIKEKFLPLLEQKLKEKNVELRADEQAGACLKEFVPATEADYATEYLDYILSIKTVSGVDEAIAHINKYNTKHSESIISENQDHIEKFLNGVDAACVYANASTRFTDGFEFGMGGEIGISTQMMHARGPMGLRELTSYKYKITGNGQIRS